MNDRLSRGQRLSDANRTAHPIDDVIAMRLDDHLHTVGGNKREEGADRRLTGGVQVRFRILDEEQPARSGHQGRDDHRKGVRDAEPAVRRTDALELPARHTVSKNCDVALGWPIGSDRRGAYNRRQPPFRLLPQRVDRPLVDPRVPVQASIGDDMPVERCEYLREVLTLVSREAELATHRGAIATSVVPAPASP